jgi:hypothetical protein
MYSANNLNKFKQGSTTDTPSGQKLASEPEEKGHRSESPPDAPSQSSRSRAFELNEDNETGESGTRDTTAERKRHRLSFWPLGSKIPDLGYVHSFHEAEIGQQIEHI